MNMEFVMAISAEALLTAAKVSGPILVAGLIAGLAVAVFQAVTQIHEMTLTFIPKVLASAFAVAMFYEFMMRAIVDFTIRVLTDIPTVLR